MNIVYGQILSPQAFLDLITDKCYIVEGDDDRQFINLALAKNGYENLWNCSLADISDYYTNYNLVLVDCLYWDGISYEHDYRWWQVPDDKVDVIKNLS